MAQNSDTVEKRKKKNQLETKKNVVEVRKIVYHKKKLLVKGNSEPKEGVCTKFSPLFL